MATIVRLVPMPTETSFAPLGVLGYCLSRTGFFKPLWDDLQVPLKTVEHRSEAKLLDVVVSILAGCRAISQINTRMRPDLALAYAWGRERFAEQATLARTLDAAVLRKSGNCGLAVKSCFSTKASAYGTTLPPTGCGLIST